VIARRGKRVGLFALGDLRDGQARGFHVPGFDRKVIVVRRGDRVHAYLDSCPHYDPGTPMAWKTDAYLNGDGTRLACHSHGAQFDIETGECLIGPCLGRSLTKVPLHISGDGVVAAVVEGQLEETA
jgi:nitrite reductase/ring-hydroxylating ferredoxin subunit